MFCGIFSAFCPIAVNRGRARGSLRKTKMRGTQDGTLAKEAFLGGRLLRRRVSRRIPSTAPLPHAAEDAAAIDRVGVVGSCHGGTLGRSARDALQCRAQFDAILALPCPAWEWLGPIFVHCGPIASGLFAEQCRFLSSPLLGDARRLVTQCLRRRRSCSDRSRVRRHGCAERRPHRMHFTLFAAASQRLDVSWPMRPPRHLIPLFRRLRLLCPHEPTRRILHALVPQRLSGRRQLRRIAAASLVPSGGYRGLSANLMRTVPHTVLTFVLLERWRGIGCRRRPTPQLLETQRQRLRAVSGHCGVPSTRKWEGGRLDERPARCRSPLLFIGLGRFVSVLSLSLSDVIFFSSFVFFLRVCMRARAWKVHVTRRPILLRSCVLCAVCARRCASRRSRIARPRRAAPPSRSATRGRSFQQSRGTCCVVPVCPWLRNARSSNLTDTVRTASTASKQNRSTVHTQTSGPLAYEPYVPCVDVVEDPAPRCEVLASHALRAARRTASSARITTDGWQE